MTDLGSSSGAVRGLRCSMSQSIREDKLRRRRGVEGAKVYCLARSLNCVALASKPGMRCSVTNVQ